MRVNKLTDVLVLKRKFTFVTVLTSFLLSSAQRWDDFFIEDFLLPLINLF